jgi:hypothetical protein
VTHSGSTLRRIALERLARQRLSAPLDGNPATVVRHMLAIQAQDFAGSRWAIGARSRSITVADVEQALEAASIVRTWPMRGTLHLLAGEDVRWTVELLAHRALRGAASRHRQLELDDTVLKCGAAVLERELATAPWLSRSDLYAALERAGIVTTGQRGIHILGWAAHTGLIVSGPLRAKQPSFGLTDRHIRPMPARHRDHALRDLATRYLAAHAPATAADLAWWAGLPLTDARSAIGLAADILAAERIDGVEYWRPETSTPVAEPPLVLLTPPYDEILLGYKDRSATLDNDSRTRVIPGLNGIIKASILVDGRIAGTWTRTVGRGQLEITPHWFPEFPGDQRPDLNECIERYAQFLG